MAFVLRSFVNSPSVSKLEGNLRKQDWRHLAQNYAITAPSHLVKQELKVVVIRSLVEQGVLSEDACRLLPQTTLETEDGISEGDLGENVEDSQREETPRDPSRTLNFPPSSNRSVVSLELEKIRLEREKLEYEKQMQAQLLQDRERERQDRERERFR